jgi:hypothetical protein
MAPISDEEWADLIAHELPKTSDPVIQNYLKSRRALMAEDLKQRSGISFLSLSTITIHFSVRSARREPRPLTPQGRPFLPPGPVTHRQQSMRYSLPDTR